MAVQVAPYGIDQFGICPDHGDDPQTCFTGGLTHDMVVLEKCPGRRAERTGRPDPGHPRPRREPWVRWRRTGGPIDLVLVIDRSAGADGKFLQTRPRSPRSVISWRVSASETVWPRYPLAMGFVDSVNRRRQPLRGDDRGIIVSAVRSELNQGGAGESDLFDAIAEASDILDEGAANPPNGIPRAGRVVVITGTENKGNADESALAFFEALEALDTSLDTTRPPTRVDLVGISVVRTDKFDDLLSMRRLPGADISTYPACKRTT